MTVDTGGLCFISKDIKYSEFGSLNTKNMRFFDVKRRHKK